VGGLSSAQVGGLSSAEVLDVGCLSSAEVLEVGGLLLAEVGGGGPRPVDCPKRRHWVRSIVGVQ
jgi:hypothetical protein